MFISNKFGLSPNQFKKSTSNSIYSFGIGPNQLSNSSKSNNFTHSRPISSKSNKSNKSSKSNKSIYKTSDFGAPSL